jgi:hypothetical protein
MTEIPAHDEPLILRCDVTGHPCGTDTRMVGYPCQCQVCRLSVEREEDRAAINEAKHILAGALAGARAGWWSIEIRRWMEKHAAAIQRATNAHSAGAGAAMRTRREILDSCRVGHGAVVDTETIKTLKAILEVLLDIRDHGIAKLEPKP